MVDVTVGMSPAVYERIVNIAERERRTFKRVAGALLMLGCGVWRRLRQRPELLKTFVFHDKAELLLLADLQYVELLRAAMDDSAEAILDRDSRKRNADLGERSRFHE